MATDSKRLGRVNGELKVFAITLNAFRSEFEDRQVHAVVATRTKKEAQQLFGVTPGEMNNYASVTGNPSDVAIALSKPGQVFARKMFSDQNPYVEIFRKPHQVIPRRPRRPIAITPTVHFNSEELEMILTQFDRGNSPLSQGIADKARRMLGER